MNVYPAYKDLIPQRSVNNFNLTYRPGLEVIKLFPCSTQLSRNFQLLIKLKYRQIKKFLALSLSDAEFTMLINVKVATTSAV